MMLVFLGVNFPQNACLANVLRLFIKLLFFLDGAHSLDYFINLCHTKKISNHVLIVEIIILLSIVQRKI